VLFVSLLQAFATVTNGLCQYNAIAISSGRGASVAATQAVVREIVGHLRESQFMYDNLVARLNAEQRTFEEYVQSIQHGAEGEEVTLQSSANVNGFRIVVLNNSLIRQGLFKGAPMPPTVFHPQNVQGEVMAGTFSEVVIIHIRPE
jgi:hypothetical protein